MASLPNKDSFLYAYILALKKEEKLKKARIEYSFHTTMLRLSGIDNKAEFDRVAKTISVDFWKIYVPKIEEQISKEEKDKAKRLAKLSRMLM